MIFDHILLLLTMKKHCLSVAVVLSVAFVSCQDKDQDESEDVIKTDLPVVMVNTPNCEPILSKETFIPGATMSVYDSGKTYEYQCNVKGRGNSTWRKPKKPYKIKFENKQSLYGEPKDKEWVLLANYYDKSMLRNDVAFWMASNIGKFDYVPRFHFVDLILNWQYNGTYQIGEQLKIAKNRVNVGDDGFLLEIDGKAASDEVTFKVENIYMPINIKDPKVVPGDANFNYVKDYVSRADAVLFSDNWLDETAGYKSLIDMQSFVEWYLIMEITKCCDARFYTSCYMNLSRNGKLKMGPVWDFDISLGGFPARKSEDMYLNDPENFYVKDSTGSWIERLFQDKEFVLSVKDRYNDYYSRKGEILAHIERVAIQNKNSAILNNKLWGVLTYRQRSAADVESAYFEEIAYLKRWLSTRMDWLKSAFDAM